MEIELSDSEKKLLTALNGTRLLNWEFYPHYKELLEEFFSFENLDVEKEVKKFVELGLLEVVDLGEGVMFCRHTFKVNSDMLDWELSYYGNSHVDVHD